MTKMYKSNAFAAIHETASGLEKTRAIDKKTMRDFDKSCLTPVHIFSPNEIKSIRLRERVSQEVFALHLNVSPDSIRKWEQGLKHPAGSSLKLLSLVVNRGLQSIA